jgi:hypothetical protein
MRKQRGGARITSHPTAATEAREKMTTRERVIEGGQRRSANSQATKRPDAAPLSRCAELLERVAAEADSEGAARAAAILRAVAEMLRTDAAA